ncbi:MAG: immunity 26/phosphotriesterase HocA family protein [Armatimonadetes bacterium]|nr:immunity 26/phosphotriesterase HocA family protein [Armatimonadota bacterium]
MGWWTEDEKESVLTIGDEPLDAVGQMMDSVMKAYSEEVGRKPTLREFERTLEIVLAAQISEFHDINPDIELSSVALKLKRQPRRQRIARGDYFSVPLPSGGYGFGRIQGIYLTSVLFIDCLDAYSNIPFSLSELRKKRVLFPALCGYLGLADWHWQVLGHVPLDEAKIDRTEKEQLNELLKRFPSSFTPHGLQSKLEEELRRRGRIPER